MTKSGFMRLVYGSMYSGKTSELIRLAKLEIIAERKVQAFKYGEDNRYSESDLASHDKLIIPATPIISTGDIEKTIFRETDTILIDEIQFLDDLIIPYSEYLRSKGKKVILAGLDLDFRGEPFYFSNSSKHIGELMTKADHIERLFGICTYRSNRKRCGENTKRTQRLIDQKPANYDSPIKLIGAKDYYEARCIDHHFVPGKPSFKS